MCVIHPILHGVSCNTDLGHAHQRRSYRDHRPTPRPRSSSAQCVVLGVLTGSGIYKEFTEEWRVFTFKRVQKRKVRMCRTTATIWSFKVLCVIQLTLIATAFGFQLFEKCRQNVTDRLNLDTGMIFDNIGQDRKDRWVPRDKRTSGCNTPDILFFKDFNFLVAKNDTDSRCFKAPPTTKRCYDSIYNATCLETFGKEMLREGLLPIFENFSQPSVKHDYFVENLAVNNPLLITIQAIHDCSSTSAEKVLNFCDNVTATEQDAVVLRFDPPKGHFNRSSCLCTVSAVFNNSQSAIEVRAYDVRMDYGVTLNMMTSSRTNCRRHLGDNKLYWWQNKELCQTNGKLAIAITNMADGIYPYSVILRVNGTNMTVECGKTMKDYSPIDEIKDGGEGDALGTVYILCILAGVIAILIIFCCIYRWIKRKQHQNDSDSSSDEDDDEEDGGRSSRKDIRMEEVVYQQPHAVPVVADESSKSLLRSEKEEQENYFEVENSYEKPAPANNNVMKLNTGPSVSLGAQPFTMAKQPESEEEDMYNHFNEKPDVVPTGHIYDTTTGTYSSFSREPPPVETGNIYN